MLICNFIQKQFAAWVLVLRVLPWPRKEQSKEMEAAEPLQEEEGDDAAIEAGNAQGGAPPHVAHCTEERRYRTASGEGWGWTVSSRAKRG